MTRKAEQLARRLAKKLKLHSSYNPGIGAKLHIVGSENSTNMDEAKPKLRGKAQDHGIVELSFNKLLSDGVNIYCKRPGEESFSLIGRPTFSPYRDTRPCRVPGQPELRTYKAIFVVDDQETGHFTDEVVVTCRP